MLMTAIAAAAALAALAALLASLILCLLTASCCASFCLSFSCSAFFFASASGSGVAEFVDDGFVGQLHMLGLQVPVDAVALVSIGGNNWGGDGSAVCNTRGLVSGCGGVPGGEHTAWLVVQDVPALFQHVFMPLLPF